MGRVIMQPSDILSCYDGELNSLADIAGDFDASSPADTKRWVESQWRSVAAALGWAGPLERSFVALQAYVEGGVPAPHLIENTALDAFEDWHLEQPSMVRGLSPTQQRELARVRTLCLDKLDAFGVGSLNRWRPYVASTSLPESACISMNTQAPPITGPGGVVSRVGPQRATRTPLMAALAAPTPVDGKRFRVFRSDTAPSYYGLKSTPESETDCNFPVVLSLGTFPFVYGGVLGAHAPGMQWTTGTHSPARRGMKIAASFWQPELNLSQDARVVVAQYQHFRTTTDRVLTDLAAPDPETHRPIVGEVYRRGGLLHVYQGSLEMARYHGPRGVIAASSYNYIKRRFASFFAARRAFLRSYKTLSGASRSAIARNPDPCARPRASLQITERV